MTDPTVVCSDEQRREDVREKCDYYGLDYLEVSDDQLTLTVVFLGKAPHSLARNQVRIEGGRRIKGIQLTKDPEIRRTNKPNLDDSMILHVDKAGDFSTYTLHVTAPGFDSRYSRLDFSFKAGCPSELDCKTPAICPAPADSEIEINYLAKDYGSFRQLILDRLSLLMPDWTERHAADIGIALVELLAYVGDQLSYYQDAVATEAYLNTARQRISVRRHARLVDYRLHEGCNARTWVYVKCNQKYTLKREEFFFTTTLAISEDATRSLRDSDLEFVDPASYDVFQMMMPEVHLYPAQNCIHLYTWGDADCCLPKGATAATLEGAKKTLGLDCGSFLLFEERIGPKTGVEADADRAHRHVVRLTAVHEATDSLNGTELTEVCWANEDALPFALCISGIGPAPACKPLSNINVARGNLVLADHGREAETLNPELVPAVDIARECCHGVRGQEEVAKGVWALDKTYNAGDAVFYNNATYVSLVANNTTQQPDLSPDFWILAAAEAGYYRPRLSYGPLTFAEPLTPNTPASRLLTQDPRKAVPSITLKSGLPGRATDLDWSPQPDLLDSGAEDADFVVEVDDRGLANLRFGDGDLGRGLDAGLQFQAKYRVGVGRAGNIGAGAISQIVFRNVTLSGVTLEPRNPLPASGGIDPEPLANAKMFAPYAFRKVLERAITPDDYSALASAPYEPKVRKAQTRFLWSGSWYEAEVSIEPVGSVSEREARGLIRSVDRHLDAFRRIGQDVRVVLAEPVPIELEISVCVLSGYLRGHVQSALIDAFSNRALPGGGLGFFHPDKLTIGEGVAVSRIIALAQSIEGVESVQVTRLNRQFDPSDEGLTSGLLRVKPWEVPRLDHDPSFPENGTLTIKVGGGR